MFGHFGSVESPELKNNFTKGGHIFGLSRGSEEFPIIEVRVCVKKHWMTYTANMSVFPYKYDDNVYKCI